MEPLDELFDLLDRWRHLPAYQLERRADILFAIYLPAFLTDRLKIELHREMIPEFPVRMGSIYEGLPAEQQNLACKIDYVALSKDRLRAIFIELKTDALSRRERQDDYLLAARLAGLPTLVDGVVKLFLKSKSKDKYLYLMKLLESHGLVQIPAGMETRRFSGWRGIKTDVSRIKIDGSLPELSIIYLQPHQGETGEIGFEEFAGWLERFSDPLSKKFCLSLRRWAITPAGEY